MAQPARARVRNCHTCDGFAAVAITTGTRHRDGSRVSVRVACPACQGTGTAPLRSAVSAGSRA